MALYQPGQASKLTFLISSCTTLLLLAIIITGHLVLIADIWFYIKEGTDMSAISAATGVSTTILWLSVVAAFMMDIWVIINMRKGHQKAKKR